MKTIKLAGPTSVDTGIPPRGYAEVRYPVEGALTVHDDEAERLKTAGLLDGEPEQVDEPESDDDGKAEPLSSKSKAELMTIVTKEGVPLHGVTKNADIVAAIERHRTYRDNGLKDADLAAADKNELLVIAAYEGADVPQGDAATDDELRAAITAHRTAA